MATTPRKRPAKKAAAAPPKIESGADILARVNPQRRVESTSVCLRADLVREFHEADAELGRLRTDAAAGNRLAGGVVETDEIKAQARKVRKIEAEIEASVVTFTFTGLRKDEFRALCDGHPPRKGNQLDLMSGYNRDVVVDQLVRQSLTTPVFEDCLTEHGTPNRECDHETCGTWQQLVNTINPSEWAELRDTANQANSAVVDIPKSLLASQILDRRNAGLR